MLFALTKWSLVLIYDCFIGAVLFSRQMVPASKLFLLLFIHFIGGILIGYFIANNRVLYKMNFVLSPSSIESRGAPQQTHNSTSHVVIVNFSKPVNVTFNCMKTKTLLNYFNSHICVYDTKKDIYVSGAFRESTSIWEEEGVTRILRVLLRYPHLDFIDIGANIGTYTMYAAALGRFVLSIECFGPNVDRLHRAVQLANVGNRIALIHNALYTKSGEYLTLSNDALNVGGQELDAAMKPNISKPLSQNQSLSNPYVVKTIQFNDLLPVLRERGFRGAIMKVDIEGSESFVVEAGSQIFDSFDIPMVQIEWLKVRDFPKRVNILIDFFVKRNYEPRTFQCQLLAMNEVAKWPNDFCWTKKNFTFC